MPPGPRGAWPPLRLWGWGAATGQPGPRAHWGHVQDLNSAITYRITNNSDFGMDGETVRAAAPLLQAGVFYAEVRAGGPCGRGARGPEGRTLPSPGAGQQHGDRGHGHHRPGDPGLRADAAPHRWVPAWGPGVGSASGMLGTEASGAVFPAPRPPNTPRDWNNGPALKQLHFGSPQARHDQLWGEHPASPFKQLHLSETRHDQLWGELGPAPHLRHDSESTYLVHVWGPLECWNQHLPLVSLIWCGLTTDLHARYSHRAQGPAEPLTLLGTPWPWSHPVP